MLLCCVMGMPVAAQGQVGASPVRPKEGTVSLPDALAYAAENYPAFGQLSPGNRPSLARGTLP